MNTFSLVQKALNATLNDPQKAGLDNQTVEYGRVLHAVQTVVDAITPPDGGRYVVAFADISTAQTSIGERRIVVSSKPMRDRSLSTAEKAVVIATFAAHEVGHTFVTAPRKGLVSARNRHTGYHAVANLADDIILEPFMVDRAPILQDAFTFTGLWVLRNTVKDGASLPAVIRMRKDMSTPDRFNVVLRATRYGDIPEIVWVGRHALAERDWARTWADRLITTRLSDHDTFLNLCDEAWERIRTEADEDQPEPPIIIEPPEGPEGGEEPPEGPGPVGPKGPGGDEPGEDEPEPGEDEPEPGEDEGEPEPTEGGDEPPDVNKQPLDWDDESEDEDEPKGDEPKGEGGDEPGDDESEDEPEDEQGDEPGPEQDDPERGSDKVGPKDADGGGGDAYADKDQRPEDDWDKDEVDKSTHDSAHRDPYDWDARDVEQKARAYSSATVTAFGKHGSLSTTWE